MMMLAPASYAVIEMCRVPLALSVRTQRSIIVKTLALVGVIAAAGVTVKSMSQLGEIMFRPRLIAVSQAKHSFEKAEGERKTFGERVAVAQVEVERITREKEQAQKSATDQAINLKNIPKPVCRWIVSTFRDGGTQRRQVCTTPPQATTMDEAAREATDNLKKVETRLSQANQKLQELGSAGALDARVTQARAGLDDAVMKSQLHAFTGMFFAMDPAHVSDGQISEFLRIFVFVPAICVSLASTLLAMSAVQRIKQPRPSKGTTTIPEVMPQYVVGPLYEKLYTEIVKDATKNAVAEFDQMVERTQRPGYRFFRPKLKPDIAAQPQPANVVALKA
jgi:hypothetical protein